MADRYWNPAGAGNWGDTSSWAASDGAATGETVPSSSDDVYFTSTNVQNCSILNVDASCLSIDFTGGTGYSGTFAGTRTMRVYGSFTLDSAMTRSYTGQLIFVATSSGKTITLNGKTTASKVTFSGTGGEWTLQDEWNNGTHAINSAMTLTRGSLITNNQTITMGRFFSDNSNTRSLTLGSSTITCAQWDMGVATNLTFSSGTSSVDAGGGEFSGGGETFYDVSLTSNGNQSMYNSNTFNDLTIVNNASKTYSFTFRGDQTINGTLTITGNSVNNRHFVKSDVLGTARTITAAVTSIDNTDFRDMTGAGVAAWDLSGASTGDCGGNTGITFTTADDNFWIGDTGNWSTASEWSTTTGGAGNGRTPLPQDTAIFDANSFSGGGLTVTQDMPRIGSVNWTGATNTPTWTTSLMCDVFGSITLISGMTLTASAQAYTFSGRSAYTLTSAGKSWAKSITLAAVGGSLTFQDAFTTSGTLAISDGELDANDQDLTMNTFNASATRARTIKMGSGTWTLTDSSGTSWIMTTPGLTFDAETSTIKYTGALTGLVAFQGQGLAYYNIWNATTNAQAMIINGDNTFNDIKIDAGRTQQFDAGSTQTLTTLTATGASTVISSDTAATHTLSAAAGTITIENCTVSYSIATGGATWKAYTDDGNTNGGNNTGWLFAEPVPTSFDTQHVGQNYKHLKNPW